MPRKENKSVPMLPKHTPPLSLPPPSNKPSFLSVLKEGFAFGVGNSIAHRAVGSVFGSAPAAAAPAAAAPTNPEYELCVKEKNENCEIYLK